MITRLLQFHLMAKDSEELGKIQNKLLKRINDILVNYSEEGGMNVYFYDPGEQWMVRSKKLQDKEF